MQRKECMIVRDLFPSYIEQLTNDTTNAVVKQHLQECRKCRKIYQEQLTDFEEKQELASSKDRRLGRRLRRLCFLFLGGLTGVILTLFSLLVCFFTLVFFGGPAQKSHDPGDYQEIFELRMGISAGLIVFPEELAEGMTDVTFSYYYRDTWNTPTVSIFLQGTYTPEEYAAEVARLENIRKVNGDTERVLLRDESGKYPYPTYIAMENYAHQYEYAMLTGENQITYIYTSWFDTEDVEFDKKYLPDDFMTEEGREFGSGYCIYVKQQDSSGISYDTSRGQ